MSQKKTQTLGTLPVDPALDQLFGGRVLFPKKVQQAKEQLKSHGLPNEVKKQ